MSLRDRSERPSSALEAEPYTSTLPLLRDVYLALTERLQRTPAGPQAVWGPEQQHSQHPAAMALHDLGTSFEWVAVAFPGWSLWRLHLGLVSRAPGVLALGLHQHDSVRDLLPTPVADLAACGITASYSQQLGEHQADLLVLAATAYPAHRAVQILRDSALDLAELLSARLIARSAATSTPLEPTHDL